MYIELVTDAHLYQFCRINKICLNRKKLVHTQCFASNTILIIELFTGDMKVHVTFLTHTF